MKYADFDHVELSRCLPLYVPDELLEQYDKFGRKYLAKHNVQITAKKQYRITGKSKTNQRVWQVIVTMSRLGLLTRINSKSIERPPMGMTDVQYEQWWDDRRYR